VTLQTGFGTPHGMAIPGRQMSEFTAKAVRVIQPSRTTAVTFTWFMPEIPLTISGTQYGVRATDETDLETDASAPDLGSSPGNYGAISHSSGEGVSGRK